MDAESPACSLPGPWQLSHWTFDLPAVFGCLRFSSSHSVPSSTQPSAVALSAQPPLEVAPGRLQPTERESIENSDPKLKKSTQSFLAWLPVYREFAGSRISEKTLAWWVCFQGVAKSASQPNWPA